MNQWHFEIWPPRETGGQHVGPGPQGVKAVHLPTGMNAACDFHTTQHRNKKVAKDMVLYGLAECGITDVE